MLLGCIQIYFLLGYSFIFFNPSPLIGGRWTVLDCSGSVELRRTFVEESAAKNSQWQKPDAWERIVLKLGMLFWIWASWLDYQHQILKDTEHWAFPQPVGKVKLASLNLVMAVCDNLLSPWNLELLRGRRRWGSLESGAAQAEVVRVLDSNTQPKERAWLWQKPRALHGTRARWLWVWVTPCLPCFPTQEEGPLRFPRLSWEGWLGADSPCEAASCLGGKHGLSGRVTSHEKLAKLRR